MCGDENIKSPNIDLISMNVFDFMFSALMALALDDFTIKIVDTDIKRVVRQFSGHRNRITDMV